MLLTVEISLEEDGRWIADVTELPGVMCYGTTPEQAVMNAKDLAVRVIQEQIAHHERPKLPLNSIRFSETRAE